MSDTNARQLANGLPVDSDRSVELSDKQQKYLMKKLLVHYENYACEVCGALNWNVNTSLVSPMLLTVDNGTLGGVSLTSVHPSAHLSCSVCGNTKIISLASAGINLFTGEINE